MSRISKFLEKPVPKMDRYDKYVVIFMKIVAGVPHELKRKRIKPYITKVSFRNFSAPFIIETPTYRRRNTYYYQFDIEKGQMFSVGTKSPIDLAFMNLILEGSTIKQLVSSVERVKIGMVIIYMIMGIAMGAGLGYIIGNFAPMP